MQNISKFKTELIDTNKASQILKEQVSDAKFIQFMSLIYTDTFKQLRLVCLV